MRREGPSCVDYRPGWVGGHQPLLDQLRNEISWEQHEITLVGRTVPVPRLTAWMGDAAYRYSGIVNQPIPWPSALAAIRERLEREMGVDFNDDEPELGPEPTIASVSLGDRRRFVLRHRVTRECWTWDLGAGDLLVMRDESQRDYAHAVPKTSRPIGPRMNLTFREFLPNR
jgi:alkylated DNA repair dioxygenase AlkB